MKSLDIDFLNQQSIPIILNRLRQEGHLSCNGTGRSALWEKRGNNIVKHSNKHSNNRKQMP